ncbi:MAG: cysteine synthase family protein [Tumebacillaceae bacterium]
MLDVIGNTPLVRLGMDERSKGVVYAKMELMNPFGMKDRVAKHIILEALRCGDLQPGAPIIETSSGTMACGVALVGTLLGHAVHIVTDPRIDPITHAKLSSLGCDVHVVEQMTETGWQGARLRLLHDIMERLEGAFWTRQYENPDNPNAYGELVQEVQEAIGHVDILVASVGSGGSISGAARAMRKHNPNLKVVAVDATGSVIFGQPDRPGRLQGGLGNSLIAPNVDFSQIDEVHWLNDQEAFAATLQLARQEKIFAGNSSGSVYAVGRWLSTVVEPGTKILLILPDRGDRYFNTIYSPEYRQQKGLQEQYLPHAPHRVSANEVVTQWSWTDWKETFANAAQTGVR